MKKRLKFLALLVLVVPAAILALGWWLPREPSYEGKRLSDWLQDLATLRDQRLQKSNTHANMEARATAAVRAIGTNAVPYLVRDFRYSPSGLELALFGAGDYVLHKKLWLIHHPINSPAYLRHRRALEGFEALGPTASNALPQLCEWLKDKEHLTGYEAALAIRCIGLSALPKLIDCLSNDPPIARYHALVALGSFHTNAGPAVPAVVNCLQDTNTTEGTSVRVMAICVLGKMHGAAADAVPRLLPLLADADHAVRTEAAKAIRDIRLPPGTGLSSREIDATDASPALNRLLADPDPDIRSAAARALRGMQLGPRPSQ